GSMVVVSAVFGFASRGEAQVGTVSHQHKISALEGGFTGSLGRDHYFGDALAVLGDLDGNGVNDLAVAAPGDDEARPGFGAVWILSLGPDGRVIRQTKILHPHPSYRMSLGRLADLDGDGIAELAVGTVDSAGITPDFGAVEILFLRPSGEVRATREIVADDP